MLKSNRIKIKGYLFNSKEGNRFEEKSRTYRNYFSWVHLFN